jgi:hypothetical protein
MKIFLIWLAATIITLSAVFYQRMTGPTYPKRVKTEIEGKPYKLKLLRSHGGNTEAPINLAIDADIEARLVYDYYPIHDTVDWKQADFVKEGSGYVAKLPNQPPAGKLQYYVVIESNSGLIEIEKQTPVVIRFKGDVPAWALIPHVILMFVAMFLANAAGLMALFKLGNYKLLTNLTFISLLLGGMVLGPVVQKYAFGDFWTGVPFGWDLTDNKTLIAFIFWLVAVIGQLKRPRPYLTVIAAVIILMVYSIPHSMFGSELDRATGVVTQGFIHFMQFF